MKSLHGDDSQLTVTPLLRKSAVPFLRENGIAFDISSGGYILSQIAVGGGKEMGIIIMDVSDRAENSVDGFMILIPNLIAFPADYSGVGMANQLNLFHGIVGKFMVAPDRTLRFALETAVPKGAAAPEHVRVALVCAERAVKALYSLLEESGSAVGGR